MGSIETTRDRNKDLTTVKAMGRLTLDDITGWLERYYPSEMTAFVLLSVTKVEGSSLTAEDSERLLRYINDHSGALKIDKLAVVVENALAYQWGKVAEKFPIIKALPFDIRTFRSAEDAKGWFGV